MLSGTEAVQVRDLSVAYTTMIEVPHNQRRRFGRRTRTRDIRALENIDLDIPAGKAIGLIGGNGAGKSTLLKTIAGVLKPSNGEVNLWGRPYLLAPGMGFNRRLSGRENVVLGGLAAGMTMAEVQEKQESIIEFADIGSFIDLPTTTYSSGMFGRLAFAVATHVDAEILLIDEALSAGDAGFRDKAVAKVREMCDAAGTIIVVSHSTSLVSEIATDAVWLHQGSVRRKGQVGEVAQEYKDFVATSRERAQLSQDA
ncbi:MAG TPA: ATP-binding cassette domain-containing protein [Acidimicrobiia bacterium]|nr:ATP-binding cassette domain-containing protein [Acidimicrobiia bacterium]